MSMSQADISAATGLSLPTIKRAESDRDVSVSTEAVEAIRTALESAGVEFIPENGGGAGVRLRNRATHDDPNPQFDNVAYGLYEFANKHGLPLSVAEVLLQSNGPSRAKCDAAAQTYLRFKPNLATDGSAKS